jgi:hypothetical protein
LPQTPAGVAPYQAYLARGTITHPPFVVNRSGGKITADDYYQQMMISRMERQELEEQELEWGQLEREERMVELDLEQRERDQRMEMETLQKEKGQEDERKERAEGRMAQASMMAMVGRYFSAEESPTKKMMRSRLKDNSDSE